MTPKGLRDERGRASNAVVSSAASLGVDAGTVEIESLGVDAGTVEIEMRKMWDRAWEHGGDLRRGQRRRRTSHVAGLDWIGSGLA